MSAFEQLTEKLSNLTLTSIAKARILADVSVSKAKEVTEIAKLKVEIATEEDAIRKAYQEIGKLYFAERSQSPEGPYTVLCEKITAAKETIAYREERIADIKASSTPFEAESAPNPFTTPWVAHEDDLTSVPETEFEAQPEVEPETEQETDPNQVLIPEFEIDHEFSSVPSTAEECEPSFPSAFETEPTEESFGTNEPQEVLTDNTEIESEADSADSAEPESPSKIDPTADFRSYLQQESADDFRTFLTNSSTEDFRAFLNREADARFHHSTGAGETGFSTNVPPEA